MADNDEEVTPVNNPTASEVLPEGEHLVLGPEEHALSCGQTQEPEATTNGTSSLRAETARRNGSKSHGPISEAGKSRARMNAVKHGLRAETLLLEAGTAEENAVFQALRARVEEEFPARTLEEQLLLESLVYALWQKKRCLQYEARELRQEMIFHGAIMDRILRYGTSAEKRLFRALEELKRLQEQNPLATDKDNLQLGEGEQ